MFSQAAALVTDANLSTDCLRWLVDTFPDKTLFADPVSGSKAPRLQSVLPYLHAITPGLLEAESLSGRSARTDRELADMADWFHGQGVALVFITLSERGVYYSGNGARGKLVPRLPRRRIVNAGGAGDAFTAAVVYAWLRSWPLRQTAGFAMAVAELTLACTTASSPALSVESAMETYERFYAE
jgi:pseudouridine kinase